MRRTAVLLISALALSGCGEPKLDGSSDEALQKYQRKNFGDVFKGAIRYSKV